MVKAIMDRVFIKLDAPETKSGIILTDDIRQPRYIGRVVSVGERVKSVKVGDHVVFHVFEDVPVNAPTEEKDVVAVREYSLLGVINDDE